MRTKKSLPLRALACRPLRFARKRQDFGGEVRPRITRGTSVPATALRAEGKKLFRRRVGEDFGGDLVEGVCSPIAHSRVAVGKLCQQKWHGGAGLFAVPAQRPGCGIPDVFPSRFVQTVCQSGNYHQWFGDNPAQSIGGPILNFRVARFKTFYQHRNGEARMSFKVAGNADPICDSAASQFRSIGFSECVKKWLEALLSHERQSDRGTIRYPGMVGVIQHLDQLGNGGLGTPTELRDYKRQTVRSRVLVVIAPSPTAQWAWNEPFWQASKKRFQVIVLKRRPFIFVTHPFEKIWQGVCSDLGNCVTGVCLRARVLITDGIPDPVAQRVALVGRFGGRFCVPGKERDGRDHERNAAQGNLNFFAAVPHGWRVA